MAIEDLFFEMFDYEQPIPMNIERLPTSRCGHIAFNFHDKIWIWGGYSINDEAMNEFYLNPTFFWNYNLLTEKWRLMATTGSLPSPLSGASCSLIPHLNLLFIFGGFNNNCTNLIYVCDLKNLKWKTECPQNSTVPSSRDKHCMWSFKNKLYIFGGYGPNINNFTNEFGNFLIDETSNRLYGWNNQVFSYDIEKHIWQNIRTTGQVPSPRAAHASDLFGDNLYMFGGRTGAYRLNDLYSLNLQHMLWTKIDIEGSIPDFRSWHTFTNVLNCPNTMMLYGGFNNDEETHDDCWIFNLNSNSWHQFLIQKPLPRLWHSCCCTSEGDIVFFGGCINNILSSEATYTNQVDVINICPTSLLKLCMKQIYKHELVLKNQYHLLPEDLLRRYFMLIDSPDDYTYIV